MHSLWAESWAERIGLGVPDHGKHKTVEEMMAQRIEHYDAFCELEHARALVGLGGITS